MDCGEKSTVLAIDIYTRLFIAGIASFWVFGLKQRYCAKDRIQEKAYYLLKEPR